VKSCPKCGLVHADTDFVCRRCRVDLLTGERVQKVAAAAPGKSSSLLKGIVSSLTLSGRNFNPLKKVLAAASSMVQKIILRGTAEAPLREQAAEMTYCLQCGGVMKPATVPFYSLKTVLPFLALAALLFGLSFLWSHLAITATISVAGFFLFWSLRMNVWRCQECKHEIKRQKPSRLKSLAQKNN